MNKGVWKEIVREDADKKGMGPYNRYEGRVCTKKGKGVSVVKRGKRGGKRVCKRTVKERIYSAIKVTTNGASILCGEERWEEMDGTG